jgi:hypothetical protein
MSNGITLERMRCSGCFYQQGRVKPESGSSELFCPTCHTPLISTVVGAVLPHVPYCRCAYYEHDGQAVAGEPCSIHSQGCAHGRDWAQPCVACRDELWGPGAPPQVFEDLTLDSSGH